jgi:hypothetical protein
MDEREDFTTSQREGLACPRLPHEPEMGRGVFCDPVAVIEPLKKKA